MKKDVTSIKKMQITVQFLFTAREIKGASAAGGSGEKGPQVEKLTD